MKSPDFLIVQINRFSDLSESKIQTTIWPNDIIKLSSGDEYKLCGIGHHIGNHFISGHYISSVINNGEWIRYNDTEISEKTESDSKSLHCDVCIYSKHQQTLPELNTFKTKEMEQENVSIDKIIESDKSYVSEDDVWLTPKRKRGFSRNALGDNVIKPCESNNIKISKREEKEKCKCCGKLFKLLFSHLSRSKGCQAGYDIEKLREEISAKRKECNKVTKMEGRTKKRTEDEVGFKTGMANEKAKFKEKAR